MKKLKFAVSALCLMAAAASASAATLENPDYDNPNDCGASEYADDNYQFRWLTYFNVPAIANGQTVWVMGNKYDSSSAFGSTNTPVQAEFSCVNGTLYTSNQYDFSVTWTGY